MQNLLRLAVLEIDNHSYCSVKQCIADFLGKDYLPVSQLPDNAKHSKYITTRAKLLYGNDLENVLIMTGVQWSDDFEPNSLSKSLRGGVWIKQYHSCHIIQNQILSEIHIQYQLVSTIYLMMLLKNNI